MRSCYRDIDFAFVPFVGWSCRVPDPKSLRLKWWKWCPLFPGQDLDTTLQSHSLSLWLKTGKIFWRNQVTDGLTDTSLFKCQFTSCLEKGGKLSEENYTPNLKWHLSWKCLCIQELGGTNIFYEKQLRHEKDIKTSKMGRKWWLCDNNRFNLFTQLVWTLKRKQTNK